MLRAALNTALAFEALKLGRNVSTIDPFRFPGEKPESIVTLHKPVMLDKISQSHKKLEEAEPWVPAFRRDGAD